MDFKKFSGLVQKFSNEKDTDFAVYFGEMMRPRDVDLIRQCQPLRLRKNLMLMLVTNGGDASVAYRIGRAFQKFYRLDERTVDGDGKAKGPKFTLFIPNLCKSAGTILAAAATDLIMSDLAELGPIDVQLRNPSEVSERTSGLTPVQAIESLERHSKSLFLAHFEQLRFDDSLTFSTKMAAEIATELTVAYRQVIVPGPQNFALQFYATADDQLLNASSLRFR